MALSHDEKTLAVSYRGHPLSAWEIDGLVHIGHCWRTREEVARGEVIEAVWHPHNLEILGLYIEGVVFKWRPYEGETNELVTGASRLAISNDGSLFATGDVRGTVKVFITSDFTLLYQLASEDPVLSLTFSLDLRRFYDVRGHYGNVWEPNALMKFAEQRGIGNSTRSETESAVHISTVSVNRIGRVDSITVVAASPAGQLYCCGTENGTIRLYDAQRGELSELHVSKSFLSIEQIVWSRDGRYMGFSDSSKKITIMSITPSVGDTNSTVETTVQIPVRDSTKGPILQLLFHSDRNQLLVRCSSNVCVISLLSSTVLYSLEMQTTHSKWITHPLDPALIFEIGPETIRLWDWSLTKHQIYHFGDLHTDLQSPNEQSAVDHVLVTQDKHHVLVQTSRSDPGSKAKTLFSFETPSCSAIAPLTPEIDRENNLITLFTLPSNISSQIAIPLSVLSNNNLIFLSRELSICSWQLSSHLNQSPLPYVPELQSNNASVLSVNAAPSSEHPDSESRKVGGESIKLLFPLPGDWISKDSLGCCSIWNAERSFLCPRNGEVAVVRCSALVDSQVSTS